MDVTPALNVGSASPGAAALPPIPAVLEAADRLGQTYRLVSKQQIKTLAKCCLELGDDFPQHYPEARAILDNPRMAGWRKRDLLEAWLPRGRVRRKLLATDPDGAQEDNFRPLADKETS